MSDALARRWPGRGPWDEVWFLEIHVGNGRTAWIRHTLADGPHRRGLATWAILFDDGLHAADQSRFSLADLRDGAPVRLAEVELSATAARGRAGAIAWELDLVPGPRVQAMVPPLLERLGVGRTYVPAGFDLRVSGTLHTPTGPWALRGAPAVLGHIWGASNSTRAWAWAHAHVEDDDVLVEALSARLGPLRPLTTLAVWVGQERLDLTGLTHLPTTGSRWDADRWTLRGRGGGAELELTFTLPEARHRAVVRYLDPGDGRERTCTNSARATMELSIRRHGATRSFRTDTACFEVARLGAPDGPFVASD